MEKHFSSCWINQKQWRLFDCNAKHKKRFRESCVQEKSGQMFTLIAGWPSVKLVIRESEELADNPTQAPINKIFMKIKSP